MANVLANMALIRLLLRARDISIFIVAYPGGDLVARKTMRALRKGMTAKCHSGDDVTHTLLERDTAP